MYRAISPKVHPARKMECSRRVVEGGREAVSHQNTLLGTTSVYAVDDGGAPPITTYWVVLWSSRSVGPSRHCCIARTSK